MAEGLARSLAKDKAEIFSAGSRPAGFVSPDAIKVMSEIGIDISRQTSKSIGHLPQEKFHAIITMGCGDACPQIPANHRFDWQIPDPIGQPIENFRSVRDLLRQKIQSLFQELNLASSGR